MLGSPIGHSLSPVLHRAAYASLGLSRWRYDAFEVSDGAALAAFLWQCGDDWVGLSLTMPLKRVVQPLLQQLSPIAEATGSINTVLQTPDGGWRGDNTDVLGVVGALGEVGVSRQTVRPAGSAVVLGAGATAASAVAALAELGWRDPIVVVRDTARADPVRDVAAALGLQPALIGWQRAAPHLANARVVVSTVPSSAHPEVVTALSTLSEVSGVLLDVTYYPWPTALGAFWNACGGTAVGGFGMLLHQAAAQVRLMTGRNPDLEHLRAAGLATLAAQP